MHTQFANPSVGSRWRVPGRWLKFSSSADKRLIPCAPCWMHARCERLSCRGNVEWWSKSWWAPDRCLLASLAHRLLHDDDDDDDDGYQHWILMSADIFAQLRVKNSLLFKTQMLYFITILSMCLLSFEQYGRGKGIGGQDDNDCINQNYKLVVGEIDQKSSQEFYHWERAKTRSKVQPATF